MKLIIQLLSLIIISWLWLIPVSGQDTGLQFDGINDYVSFGNRSSLELNGTNTNGLTVEMWVKVTTITANNIALLYYRAENTEQNKGGFYVLLYANMFCATVFSPEEVTYYSAEQMPLNTWTHVAFQLTPTTATMYLNGSRVQVYVSPSTGVVAMPNACSQNASALMVGIYNKTSFVVDELRISDTVRYTSNFIPQLYPYEPDNNTRALWHFNEGTGIITLDDSPYGNHGILVNGTSWVPGYYSTIDNIKPADINNLVASPGINPGSIILNWVSPGDDGVSGNLTGKYKIQYSSFTPQWDRYSAQITENMNNVTPGSNQSYTVNGLSAGTTYYFSIWICDEVYNWTNQSNIASCFAKVGQSNPPNKPNNLLCNGLVNPNSVSNFNPTLSWNFSDPDYGDVQSAYRLIVADNINNINNNTGNMLDTNKVMSSVGSMIYNGAQLQYSATYYWKVMVWDNNNTQSQYSDVATFIMRSSPTVLGKFMHPYGVNSWQWPLTACQAFKNAHIDRYRIMVNWPNNEPSDNNYQWESSLDTALDSAAQLGAKVSLCVYLSFDYTVRFWAATNPDKRMSVNPTKYAEFITALLQHCENRRPGIVEAVEILNEEPTGEGWSDKYPVTHNTDQRDPSWYYMNILKSGYNAVKSFNSNILVVMDAMWSGAYHHLDELYQLGLKNYFDRINFHYYVQDFGAPEDPSYTGSTWHFPTTLKYIKYIAEQNNDNMKNIWLSEFGWRISDEKKKSDYMKYVLDQSRKSGFVEETAMYVGLAGGWPNNYDKIGLIYTDKDWQPSFLKYTTAYYMYVDFGNQYPTWDPNNPEQLLTLTPASKNVDMINYGFELGNTMGWEIVGTTDTVNKHSGLYSGKQTAPNTVRTQFYPVEPGKLYEVVAWVKIDAANSDACMLNIRVVEKYNGTNISFYEPPNYYGIVDTRNYPNGWRRLRFMYLVPTDKNEVAIEFVSFGTGTYWVDDVSISALNFMTPSPDLEPIITLSSEFLDFADVAPGQNPVLSFEIRNIGGGTLTGTLVSDKEWLLLDQTSFVGNNVVVNVSIDRNILGETDGEYTGTINITSNGGNKVVRVYLVATCVLVKPNPYNPYDGVLTFFGNGIIPGQTTIKIYTISGEHIRTLDNKQRIQTTLNTAYTGINNIRNNDNEIIWDGKDKYNNPVINGIYLYTYESPAEKGINKFTVIAK